jgi:hypothetical protein
MYQRTVKEWERQRHRLEMEHWELMSRVDYLADEVYLVNILLIKADLLNRLSLKNDWE